MTSKNPPTPNTPNRSLTSYNQSRSSTPHNVPNAALAGALSAFARPSPKPQALVSPSVGSNGALSAAKLVKSGSTATALTRGSTTAADLPHSLPDTVISKGELTPQSSKVASRVTSPSRSPKPINGFAPSFSYTAANIATAKRSPTALPLVSSSSIQANGLPNATGEETIRTRSRISVPTEPYATMDGRKGTRVEQASLEPADNPTDATSIAPTTSLVKIFEQQSGRPSERERMRPAVGRKPSLARGKPPPIIAPKPQRSIPIHSVSPELERPPLNLIPKRVSTIAAEPAKKGLQNDSDQRRTSVPDNQLQEKPNLPLPRRAAKKPTSPTGVSSSSDAGTAQSSVPTQGKTRSVQRPPSQSPAINIRPNLPSNTYRPSPAPYQDQSMKSISPHITGDSLANAMVSANLALKHTLPKRSKTPPPLPTPRRKQQHHDHNLFHRSRSLSPKKKPVKREGMLLRTLRPDEDGENDKRNRNHRYRHPNKHHEGTRERWREEVQEFERKRYEGVWAANKGLFISPTPSPASSNLDLQRQVSYQDEVLNLIVRDIWSRSRLPAERLAMVWDLVTQAVEEPDTGRLSREQFVVGMWLIDQMLKGRNLPHVVSQSVWASVTPLGGRGVKVRLAGKGRDGRKLERGSLA